MPDLKGKKGGDAGDAEKAAAAKINRVYESHPIQVPAGAGDHSLKDDAGVSAFEKVPVAHNLAVKVTTPAVTLVMKLKGDNAGDPINVSQAFPFNSVSIEFEDIVFVKQAGAVDVEVVYS